MQKLFFVFPSPSYGKEAVLSTTQASDGIEAPLKPQVLMKLVLALRRFRD
jgi:hypothetical protein